MNITKKKYHCDTFEKAREYVRSLGILTLREWKIYSKLKRPINIPSNPNRTFKNKGWINWVDWFGTNKLYYNRKYTVNNNYFKELNRNNAYVLGFWFADGYMCEKRNIFSISQHKKDKYLMEKILIDMDSNYPFQKNGNNLYFNIASTEIIKDVKKYGGHQAKSHTIQFPKNIPKEYLPDFIRGCWDGDGCISFQKSNNAFVSSILSASKNFIYDLLEALRNEIKDFKGTVFIVKKGYFQLNVGVNDTRRLRDYLYNNISENSLYLKRKHEKFMQTGNINISDSDKVFISYEEASLLAQKQGIKHHKEWRIFREVNNIENIPYDPSAIYNNSGWINWKTFIGN